MQISPVLPGRLQDGNDHRFALTFEYRIDAALSMFQDLGPREGGTVTPDHNQSLRQECASRFRQINDSGTLAR